MKKSILVIAPHPDDEIIGCGGTILKHIDNGDDVYVCVVTKGTEPLFTKESVENTRRECLKCHSFINIKQTFFLDFPASMLEKIDRHHINQKILDVIKATQPDEVYIPHFGDMQKDHQIVSESCMVALRPKYHFMPKRVFLYETLSETGWNIPNASNEFIPNRFVDISEQINRKMEAFSIYKSQLSSFPNARSLKAIEALATYRGSLMSLKAAEAFAVVREIE